MHSHGSDGGSRRKGERHVLGHTGRVEVLATLDVGSSAIFLRRVRTDAHRFYKRLGFVASHEGMKLMLDRE